MKKLFNRILGRTATPKMDQAGGFTSRGAVAVNGYSSPPPPPPPRPPSGGGGNDGSGGKGPDFHCTREELINRGYTQDVVNCVTQSGLLTAWATNALNDEGKKNYGDRYIQQYRGNDHAFIGKSQVSEGDHKLLRFHADSGKAGGRWHASMDEMQRKAQLRFNASSHNTASHNTAFTAAANNMSTTGVAVAVSVKKFLDLPSMTLYSSEARFTPTIVEVEISRTVSGKQQVYVENHKQGLNYSNERKIEDLFSWLKFKPGG